MISFVGIAAVAAADRRVPRMVRFWSSVAVLDDDAAVEMLGTTDRRLLSCNPSVVERSDTAMVANEYDSFMMMDRIGGYIVLFCVVRIQVEAGGSCFL